MKFGKETEVLEFKKTTGELKEAVISAVAMLNKHRQGELYFGIRNDGEVIGQEVTEKTLRDVSQAFSNHIEPKIFPTVREAYLDNSKHCIHVTFEGENVPYYAYGRAYIRVADEDKMMSAKEIEKYILSKRENKIEWDSQISEKSVDDIDETLLKDYIDKANFVKRINYKYSNKKDILNRLNLLKDNKIVNTAEVMFCPNVNLEIQMAIFATPVRLTFIDIKRYNGTVIDLVEKGEDYIKNIMRWRVVLDGSIQRKEIPEIPVDAIREALINSYCHRDYTVPQTNEIDIHPDRIEIYNPGTFPDGLKPEDFINGSEHSVPRNPLLAQVLYYSKDIEKFGTGIRRIYDTCKEADVKVEFKTSKLGFSVIFHRKNLEYENTSPKKEKGTSKTTKTERENQILEFLKNGKTATSSEISEILGVSVATTKRALTELLNKNLIKSEGEKRYRTYSIK